MSVIANQIETHQSLTLCIKQRTTRYMDEFVLMDCGVDLHELKLFPNAKEITESFAMFNAYRKHLLWSLKSERGVMVIVIGDGSTPRTAATFAFRTKHYCVSIDPKLNLDKCDLSRIRQLRVLPFEIQNNVVKSYLNTDLGDDDAALIVLPHSHAPAQEVLKATESFKRRAIISMDCCQENDFGTPDIEYDDWGVWSPKRTIKIWKDYNEKS